MSKEWKYQLRIDLGDDLAEAARRDPNNPAIKPLADILTRHHTDQDGKISQTEFKEACKNGLVKCEHAESAKMGKDEPTHKGDVGESPPAASGKMQGQ